MLLRIEREKNHHLALTTSLSRGVDSIAVFSNCPISVVTYLSAPLTVKPGRKIVSFSLHTIWTEHQVQKSLVVYVPYSLVLIIIIKKLQCPTSQGTPLLNQ